MAHIISIVAVWLVALSTIECISWTYPDPKDPRFKVKCIEDLECFSTGPPWYDYPMRVATNVPEDCENITYNLFTPHNPEKPYVLQETKKSILGSPFNASWPTQLYIHAYWADQGSIDRELNKKDAALSNYHYNVIVPDFRDHVQIPYFRSVANIRVIAARIAKFLKYLMAVTGIKPESIHLIGFSLGCHTCGYIGKRIPNLGRITGLSPAGRNFVGTAEETRLVPTDALFVDVIITSGDGDYGLQQLDAGKCGHQNFFVNNARRQPGCSLLENTVPVINFMKDFPETYCDHIRSNTLWSESLRRKDCTFRAVKCKSYEAFERGECTEFNSPVAIMGIQAGHVPGVGPEDTLYLDTWAEPPYCNENNVIPRAMRKVTPKPPTKWMLNE
ncbi:pancreatic lipase-related protein 3-like [Parasteatoda tepidariorum]|nr:pancreatic lipase-related protein 3-like [Parasteatoda tepidariorum]